MVSSFKAFYFLFKSKFTWKAKWNQSGMRLHLGLKISLRCSVSSLLVLIWIKAKWSSNRYGFHISNFGQNELSNWHEILMSKKITRSEMNKRRFCVLLRLMRMCVKSALRALFHFGHFDRKKSFQVIIYHGNTTQNKMPKHFHQKIGSFRNTAEMKRHRNRTSFQTGLKSHTGLSSSRLSYKRTLSPVTKHLGM